MGLAVKLMDLIMFMDYGYLTLHWYEAGHDC